MRKIFIIGPAYPLRGGLATFDELFCRAFNAAGAQCEIVSYSLQYPNFLFPGSTQYDTSGKAPQGIRIHTLINSVNPFSWFKTARFINKQKPDFVVFRFWIPFMGPALGTIARLLRHKGVKVLAITDNVIPHEKRAGDRPFTKYFIRSCDGYITMSQAVLNDLAQFTDTPHKRFLLHPLYTSFGEKLPKAEARRKLGIGENEKIILFFGLIRKYKGLDLLLEAMADPRVKQLGLKLLIAGEFYEDRSYYDEIIVRHGLSDQIIMHAGFVANEEVKTYFSAADLVTLTYRTATQSGVTQVAFHFEKPVLVTNVGGLSEIVPADGGYVVERDARQVADALVDFYEQQREEAFSQGMAREKKKYDWSIFVNETLNLYEQITTKP